MNTLYKVATLVFKGSASDAVFVSFYFGRNQIELFQELKILNRKIARNLKINGIKNSILWDSRPFRQLFTS